MKEKGTDVAKLAKHKHKKENAWVCRDKVIDLLVGHAALQL